MFKNGIPEIDISVCSVCKQDGSKPEKRSAVLKELIAKTFYIIFISCCIYV
jgi:hypothetical protein